MTKKQVAYRRGHLAELLAGCLLTCKGYRVLKRRWRSPYGEIDLIAKRRRTLIFVEVKARPTEREALEAISPHQRQRIAQSAAAFLQQFPHGHRYSCRFDVMSYSPPLTLKHLPDAWRM